MVWPFIAREAIRKTLACTIGDLGDYFSYVMGTFLYHDEGLFPTDDEFKEAGKMERKLGKMLNTCNVLLELTDHEPRLKGPFPKEFYREMLISSHNLLDRMMSLRIILIKMSPSVKKTVRGLDIYHYRRDMVSCMLCASGLHGVNHPIISGSIYFAAFLYAICFFESKDTTAIVYAISSCSEIKSFAT